MIDISDVTLEEISGGYAVVPLIETKRVIIPSPPSTTYVPINPRPAVIYLTAQPVTPASGNLDQLKAYAKENNIVFICPTSREIPAMVAACQYADSKARTLNFKRDDISLKADAASLELANELNEALCNEDLELDDAEVLAI